MYITKFVFFGFHFKISGEENEGRLRKPEILDSPDFNHLNAMDTEGSPAIHVSVPGASRSNPLLPQLQPRFVVR